MELPPRARRILPGLDVKQITTGTTSACAENTHLSQVLQGIHGNYLRVRGEYQGFSPQPQAASELPPRARRIRQGEGFPPDQHGTTSACAENTININGFHSGLRNYLRVRGEYGDEEMQDLIRLELPPRARRIPPTVFNHGQELGTTSACAENTISVRVMR